MPYFLSLIPSPILQSRPQAILVTAVMPALHLCTFAGCFVGASMPVAGQPVGLRVQRFMHACHHFCACLPGQAEVEAANATWSYTAYGRTVHAFTLMENPLWNGSTSMVSPWVS